MNENALELVCIGWLKELGYECLEEVKVNPEENIKIRKSYTECILQSRLREAIERLNFDATNEEKELGFQKLNGFSANSMLVGNQKIYDWLRNGVPVEVKRDDGTIVVKRLKIFDFDGDNKYSVVRHMSIMGLKLARPDLILFVNGLPLVIIELSQSNDSELNIEKAYDQIQDYKSYIPQIFNFNLFNVITDGLQARYGSFTESFERFLPWRLLNESILDSQNEFEVLIKGLLNPKTLMDFFKGFVIYLDEDGVQPRKIIAQWHQYHDTKGLCQRLSSCFLSKEVGKKTVIWHTKGLGKTLKAIMFVINIRSLPEFNNPSVVIVTDHNVSENHWYKEFTSSSWSLRDTPQKAESRAVLKSYLDEVDAGGIFFAGINHFVIGENKVVDAVCTRSNIIVIWNEIHRSQSAFKAAPDNKLGYFENGVVQYMHTAFPNATHLGITATPISYVDTDVVFDLYVDKYDMIAAQKDGTNVPIGYEGRLLKFPIEKTEQQSLVNKDVEIFNGYMKILAKDFVKHWELRKEQMEGKAIFVAFSRHAAVELYNEVITIKPDWHHPDVDKGKIKVVMSCRVSDPEEFQPHRTTKTEREIIKNRLKNPDDELEVVIVRDMLLSGFNAPPVHTLYIYKPMKGYALMQAITRTSQVWRDKSNGLVVDYIGLQQNFKDAITQQDTEISDKEDKSPFYDSAKALKVLLDTLNAIRMEFYNGFDYKGYKTPTEAISLLLPAMEHLLQVNTKIDKQGRNSGITKYIDLVNKLTKVQSFVGTLPDAQKHKDEIAFFQAVKVGLIKLTYSGASQGQNKLGKEAVMRPIVGNGALVDGVQDIFQTLGLGAQNQSLLDENFLGEIQVMPTKKLAVEMILRLLNDQILARGRKNAIQGQEFTKKLYGVIQGYHGGSISTFKVIQLLIDLAREFNQSGAPSGMTDEEFAIYQILTENNAAIEDLGDSVLKALAFELTDKLRKSAIINWQNRKVSRAKMNAMVKFFMKKYSYSADNEIEVIEKILTQAELLADEWAFEV
ncbi:type I restriction endonuclease subunit R [Acinetobacter baumannii]|nr:type I restriction endonuclease subunit R [Acinetobacter baumannii]EKW1173122.1 type I restriction endonuclease subunit R [Acinetobacter baumannii]